MWISAAVSPRVYKCVPRDVNPHCQILNLPQLLSQVFDWLLVDQISLKQLLLLLILLLLLLLLRLLKSDIMEVQIVEDCTEVP